MDVKYCPDVELLILAQALGFESPSPLSVLKHDVS
jgi:hypothetical protein